MGLSGLWFFCSFTSFFTQLGTYWYFTQLGTYWFLISSLVWSVDRLALSSSNYEANATIVRDGLVGKLQGVGSRCIGILSNDTWLRTVYIGWQVVQVDR